ncbi:MAG: InlB B-repeat-containing protein [Bifidobacterium sp.]|nr:InlB B-repeat-containing protein [Bifidobacterium sp.]
MGCLFADGNTSLTTLDLHNLNTAAATRMDWMFSDDPSLASLDLSNFSFRQNVDTGGMFNIDPQILRFLRLPQGVHIPARGPSYRSFFFNRPTSVTWRSEDGSWSGAPYNVGMGPAAKAGPVWYGRPKASIAYDANGGSVDNAIAPTEADAWPDAMPHKTISTGNGLKRAHYQFTGWNTASDGQGISYTAGQDVTLPLGGKYDTTLYAVWKAVPVPTIESVVAKSDGVHVSGKLPGGTQTGDRITVTDSNSKTSTVSPAASIDGSWEAVLPIPADNVGKGNPVSYTATHTLSTGEESLSSSEFATTVDVIAPGIEGLKYNKDTQTFTGTVWSSGDATAQSGRQIETGDTVTATWPNGTTTASAVSDTSGAFTIHVPNGAETTGIVVRFKVSDTAGTHGLNGISNVSADGKYELQLPVYSLPLTGGNAPRILAHRLFAAILLACLAGVLTSKRLQNRHLSTRDISSQRIEI